MSETKKPMNPKVQQLLHIHKGWIDARKQGLNKVAHNFDLDHEAIYNTLTREEKGEYYQELERQYPRVKP